MASTTIEASSILNRLLIEEPKMDVLSDSSLHMIKKNMSNDVLAYFANDVDMLIEIYRNYKAGKDKPRFPKEKINIVYAILKFISNPFAFINAKNFRKIDTEDPTHSYVQKEVIKLGIAYIKKEMVEYRLNRQHLKSSKRRAGTVLY